jgi:hypothetical protein
MTAYKNTLLSLFCLCSLHVSAQYTEVINTNRPGGSQGAYAPGKMVFQGEVSGFYGQQEHSLLNYEDVLFGTDFQLRAGLFLENLELNYQGTFTATNRTLNSALGSADISFGNFSQSVLGAKYLIYDPWKKRDEEGPNLYSWKANNAFQWKYLIPAVSLFAGANLNFSNPNSYLPPGDTISPLFTIITQNNLGRWVIVTNINIDRVTTAFPSFGFIGTVTHTLTEDWAAFLEYQVFASNFYSDNLLRGGAAFLITKDLQVDVSGTMNFRDTPTVFQVNVGAAYRLDFYKDSEVKQDKSELNAPQKEEEGQTRDGRR